MDGIRVFAWTSFHPSRMSLRDAFHFFHFPVSKAGLAWPFETWLGDSWRGGKSHRVIFEFPVEQFQLITTYILLVSQPDVDKTTPSRKSITGAAALQNGFFGCQGNGLLIFLHYMLQYITDDGIPGRDRRLQTPCSDRRWSLSADVPEWVAW